MKINGHKVLFGILSVGVSLLIALLLLPTPERDRNAQAEAKASKPVTSEGAPKPPREITLAQVMLPPPPAEKVSKILAKPPEVSAPKPTVAKATASPTVPPTPTQQHPKSPAPANKVKVVKAAHKTAQRTGRILLRQLEAGSGPAIEIAWPDAPAARRDLAMLFSRCYGMTLAVLTADARLYRDAEPTGVAWRPNSDAFSGFLRQAAGARTVDENRAYRRILSRHALSGGTLVRLFPRSVDAAMLGGMHAIAGANYIQGSVLHARYGVHGNAVSVFDITVDDVAVPGAVHVPSRCR